MKKVLLALLVLFVLLVGAAVAIPYFFKDEIVTEVKKAANKQLNATLEFSDVDISLFRQFPKLSVGLNDLKITGKDKFDGVKLMDVARLDLGVDLMKAINKEIVIRNLHLEKPYMHVFVMADGAANYDIAKETASTEPTGTAEAASPIQLEAYTISDGHIIYEDHSLDMKTVLKGLNHKGSGNLGATIYDLDMSTEVDALTVDYGGMRYLSKAHALWDAVLAMDMQNSKYTFKENDMVLNDLKVALDGWVQMPNETDILMDLTFGSPANDFKRLLSIIPGAYTKDFAGVKAAGTLGFNGFAKGTYNDHAVPKFKLDFKVGDASFQYPDLPLGMSNINFAALVNSPSSNFDKMTVDIPKFALNIGSNPLSGYFKLRTPMSDPTVDTKLKGKLNFAELAKAFPIEGLQELTGTMDADFAIKAAMSQIDNARYEQVDMAGQILLQNMVYRAEATPPVRVTAMEMDFSPQYVNMPRLTAKIGKSDFSAFGKIDNILALFGDEKTMTGKMTLRSALIDANELMGTENSAAEAVKTPEETEKPFDRWDFTVDSKIGKILYEDYTLTDVITKGHFKANAMDIDDFSMKIGSSDLAGSGTIIGATDYLYENRTLRGDLKLKSYFFDLNQFMTDEADVAAASGDVPPEDVLLVPENMDINVDADMRKVLYSNYTLTDLEGTVAVADEKAQLKDCTARTLGGQVGLTGFYNTSNKAEPLFNMDMAVKELGFPQVWKNVVTVQKFAPIAQFIDGKLNTTISLSGVLGNDMMPDLNTLSVAGFLETVNAVVNNFKPLNEIGNKLNVSALRKLDLGYTRNWFEIKDGKVKVQPFDVQAGDIAMKVSGAHGLTSEMDYQIITKTPRVAMEKNPVGAAASSGLSWLSKEASKYGVSLNQGDFINVQFNLAGTMASPKISLKVLGSDGESTVQDEARATAQAVVDKAKDSLRTVAQNEVNKVKDKANTAVDKAVDSLKTVANEKVDEVKDKVVNKVKDEIGAKASEAVGGAISDKAKDALGEDADKKVDEVKDKLKKWNPFGGKKKKEGGR